MNKLFEKIMDLWAYAGEYLVNYPRLESAKYFELKLDEIHKLALEQGTEMEEYKLALELAVDMIEKNITPECERGWMDKQERLDYFIEQAKAKLKMRRML